MTRLIILVVFLLSIFSCSDKNNNETLPTRTQAPVGETFSDGIVTLIFESPDSLQYYHRDKIVKGKAAYIFKNGEIEIVNPHGKRLDPKDVLEPYFLGLKGTFSDYNTIDVSYGIVSKYERDQIVGHTFMLLQK